MDPIIEPDGLCHAEANALIEAAWRVVRVAADYLNAFDRTKLRDAVAELEAVLGHVTPDDEPDDENKPAPLPWWTPEDIRRQMEGKP